MSEKEAIVLLLNSPCGYGLELFLVLGVSPIEDGRFSVWQELTAGSQRITEEIFDTADEAATRFLELRAERKLGFDYEATEMMSVAVNGWS